MRDKLHTVDHFDRHFFETEINKQGRWKAKKQARVFENETTQELTYTYTETEIEMDIEGHLFACPYTLDGDILNLTIRGAEAPWERCAEG